MTFEFCVQERGTERRVSIRGLLRCGLRSFVLGKPPVDFARIPGDPKTHRVFGFAVSYADPLVWG